MTRRTLDLAETVLLAALVIYGVIQHDPFWLLMVAILLLADIARQTRR